MKAAQGLQPAGIEYHGVAGISKECTDAVVAVLQLRGSTIVRAKLLTCEAVHALLLLSEQGDPIAVKSGFSSGYSGEGPRALSYVLALLEGHGVDVQEIYVGKHIIAGVDRGTLSLLELDALLTAPPDRADWRSYIAETDLKRLHEGTLWKGFPRLIPLAILDPRIAELGLRFWADPDAALTRGYRRLEDAVRRRTGLNESSTKLFARAFDPENGPLHWNLTDGGERSGRMQLFTSVYLAFRNPRAHREHPGREAYSEFLLLNELFRLEAQAVLR